MKSNFYKNITETSVAEPEPVGDEAFLAGAGADLKFELEPEPKFCVGSGFFFLASEKRNDLKVLIVHCIGTVLYIFLYNK